MRVAASYEVPPHNFVQAVWTKYVPEVQEACPGGIVPKLYSLNYGFRYESELLALVMSAAIGIAAGELDALRIYAKSHRYRHYLLLGGLLPRLDPYCLECLATSFHLRRSWQAAYLCYCVLHRRPLQDRCPQCQVGLSFGDLALSHRYTAPPSLSLRCQGCQFDLVSTPGHQLSDDDEALLRLLGADLVLPR